MDQRISDILNDLYKIDPQFKTHEPELRKLVSELLLSKPDTHFDEHFASRLRTQLLNTRIKPMPTPSPYSSFFMSRMFYSLVGSAMTILIVVPFTFVATQRVTSPEKDVVLNPFSPQVKDVTTGLSPKQQISNKGMNAFGTLALVPTANQESAPADSNTSAKSAVEPQSLSTPTSSVTLNGPKGGGNVGIMPPRPGTAYTYTYKGEAVSLNETQGEVFMRTKGIDSSKQLTEIINNSNFGLTDLSSFSNLKLKNLTLAQDSKEGYMLSVNFSEGTISINPNWQYWTIGKGMPESTTATLETGVLISIANEFVKAHGIDTSSYGAPRTQDGNFVIYPLIVGGKEVYEESGSVFGLIVTIDPQSKKVSDINNLMSQTYDSSRYTLETDFAAIVRAATTTLINNYGGMDPAANSTGTAQATLGTPKPVLMHYWLYDENRISSSELFIPALSFPISYSGKVQGAQTTIVVPLVKDFLAKHNGANGALVESTNKPQ
ncbi:MAG: hypothetical protein K0S38_28 [Candidatus Paceibacter sp.]|jgi:hypothetical protein|nr:hypothetical protein [Candidatus Paceibacter sp.]